MCRARSSKQESSKTNSQRLCRVCVITCYSSPDYVRASTLRKGVEMLYGKTNTIIVKNTSKGILRYIEVLLRIMLVRIRSRPDVYLLTFRGYEMVLPLRIVALGKPFVFDEFINLEEWLLENAKVRKGSIAHRIVSVVSRLLMTLPDVLITDTQSHAEYSRERNRLKAEGVLPVPVATDEDIFYPKKYSAKKRKQELEVFFYGSKMLPLHGLVYILKAAVILKDRPIHFTIIGGDTRTEEMIGKYKSRGARVSYMRRVGYVELSKYMDNADVCLGGPFGDTLQSQFIITGKTYQFMASGKPCVIGKNIESNNDYFVHKKNCLMVNMADARDLSKVLGWCSSNTKELKLIGQDARKTYLENMSVAAVSERLSGVFGRFGY